MEVRGAGSKGYNDLGVEHDLSYAVDANCNVTVTSGASKPVTTQPSSSASTEKKSASGSSPSGAVAASVIYGNVIHSTQVMQDWINIDIAKLKYSHDRVWDNIGYTYFKWNWWVESSTSRSWNHPLSAVNDGYDGAWRWYDAYGFAHGDFHSDFLWCNFQPGQNFRMNTNLRSFWQGSYDAYFSQNRACAGTHMSTSKSANINQGL